MSIEKIRLEELEKAHAFIALHYVLRVAERLEAWAKTHADLDEVTEADAMKMAAERVRELAAELGKGADLKVGDLT